MSKKENHVFSNAQQLQGMARDYGSKCFGSVTSLQEKKSFGKNYCFGCNNYVAEEKVLSCGNCGLFRYCNKECQSVHWKKRHKQDCKEINSKRQFDINISRDDPVRLRMALTHAFILTLDCYIFEENDPQGPWNQQNLPAHIKLKWIEDLKSIQKKKSIPSLFLAITLFNEWIRFYLAPCQFVIQYHGGIEWNTCTKQWIGNQTKICNCCGSFILASSHCEEYCNLVAQVMDYFTSRTVYIRTHRPQFVSLVPAAKPSEPALLQAISRESMLLKNMYGKDKLNEKENEDYMKYFFNKRHKCTEEEHKQKLNNMTKVEQLHNTWSTFDSQCSKSCKVCMGERLLLAEKDAAGGVKYISCYHCYQGDHWGLDHFLMNASDVIKLQSYMDKLNNK